MHRPKRVGGLDRRDFLRAVAVLAAGGLAPRSWASSPGAVLEKAIPSTGERLPVVGMGSWLTFDVDYDPLLIEERVEVLRAFFEHGATLIDSSPMYGSSEAVIGHCLDKLHRHASVFAATKVWTLFRSRGIRQMEASEERWGVERFDLMQIHNMLDWRAHLETLREWKASGRIRYLGITTSHGRRHEALEAALRENPFDFVQLTYNIDDREAERRLLPLARERGIAVIANRPFQGGELFERVRGEPLPGWAGELDCATWSQLFLKFIVSHPAVTCAIPATSRVDHMVENMGALRGRLPDAAERRRLVEHFREL